MVNESYINKGVEYVSNASNYFIELLNLSQTSGKVLNIIILLSILYGAMKLGEKPLRILIIILTIILIIQVSVSYI